MDDADKLPFTFTAAGIDLRMLFKRLKPGFPRLKKTVAASRAQLVVRAAGELTVRMPGAESRTACKADADFTVDLPLAEIIALHRETYRDSEEVAFAFGPGRMRFRSMTFTHVPVQVWRTGDQPTPLTQAADPLATGIGLPLLATYHTLRRHPSESFSGNAVLGPAKVEIDSILTRAGKLLAPLGIDRARLEAMLDSMKD